MWRCVVLVFRVFIHSVLRLIITANVLNSPILVPPPDDGADTSLRNVGSYESHTAYNPEQGILLLLNTCILHNYWFIQPRSWRFEWNFPWCWILGLRSDPLTRCCCPLSVHVLSWENRLRTSDVKLYCWIGKSFQTVTALAVNIHTKSL
jgi:hypothetical protein